MFQQLISRVLFSRILFGRILGVGLALSIGSVAMAAAPVTLLRALIDPAEQSAEVLGRMMEKFGLKESVQSQDQLYGTLRDALRTLGGDSLPADEAALRAALGKEADSEFIVGVLTRQNPDQISNDEITRAVLSLQRRAEAKSGNTIGCRECATQEMKRLGIHTILKFYPQLKTAKAGQLSVEQLPEEIRKAATRLKLNIDAAQLAAAGFTVGEQRRLLLALDLMENGTPAQKAFGAAYRKFLGPRTKFYTRDHGVLGLYVLVLEEGPGAELVMKEFGTKMDELAAKGGTIDQRMIGFVKWLKNKSSDPQNPTAKRSFDDLMNGDCWNLRRWLR